MSIVNLDEVAGLDYIEFSISDNEFKMRIPSSKDLLELAPLAKKSDDLSKAGESEEIQKANEEILAWYAQFVECTKGDIPDFAAFLMEKPTSYLRAFTKLVDESMNGQS